MSETIIHPETGAILRRRKRMETVTHQGQSRTVEVEGWFPDDEGDGILVGADSKPLDAALAEMKAGWPDPARPGVPMNPERDGWHWLKTPDENDAPYEWRGSGECERGRWPAYWVLVDADNWQPAECTYIAPVLTPAEVDARVAKARRDAREQVARYHDLMAKMAGSLTELQRRSSWVHSESAKAIRSGIDIRVLGEKE